MKQPWERRYYCEGCGTRIPLCRVHKNNGLCHGCEADDGAIDLYDEDLLEAQQDERELREAFEYEQRGRVPTNPLDA